MGIMCLWDFSNALWIMKKLCILGISLIYIICMTWSTDIIISLICYGYIIHINMIIYTIIIWSFSSEAFHPSDRATIRRTECGLGCYLGSRRGVAHEARGLGGLRAQTHNQTWCAVQTCDYADPSDLLEHLLSIVSAMERMCAIDSKSTVSFPCACSMVLARENIERDLGITIVVNSASPLIHHVLNSFAPENVCCRCEVCHLRSSDERPAFSS